MFLKSIKVQNFKNFSEIEYGFSPKINAFVGKNGVGKTNLLDAVHYLALTKSYLNYSDIQNIHFNSEFFTIEGIFKKEDEDVIFCAVHRDKGKTFKKNAKTYDRISMHIGCYPLVMISPYDIDLIKDGSDTRRKFIDNIISQSDKEYLNDLIRYNRALNQRNSLLKYFFQNQTFDADSLEIYDRQMIQFGNKIHQRRAKFIQEFEPVFQQYYRFISRENEKVNIQYISQLNTSGFEDLLKSNRPKDRTVQFTTTGIHKDDLSFEIMNYPVKKFGSQGQQKSYLIALKLAKLEIIKKNIGITPILLLDDIFDKLDESRVEQLIKLVNEERFGQIFITDTHPERTEKIVTKINAESKIFKL
ncbi:MAG TPA: DNA replication/repair protein RecF [Moheibacter sp.]|nr:DNA replication/repair protein RecF [Moheibacter sp.]